MRLIDADEAKNTWCRGCDACKKAIDQIPTVEPKTEYRQGRKEALDEVYAQYLNRDNDDSFREWLMDNLLD